MASCSIVISNVSSGPQSIQKPATLHSTTTEKVPGECANEADTVAFPDAAL